MSKRLIAMSALAIALGGITVVISRENRSSPVTRAEASVPSAMPVETDPRETVHDPANKNRKIVVSIAAKNSILVDVPDDELDHANLEEFVGKRPMDAYRVVHVNSDALRAIIREVDQQPSFELQLLSASPVTLVARDAEEHSSGWETGLATWRGTVAGDDHSYATFVVSADGSLHGKIRSRDSGRIAIEPIPNTPYHMVWRLQKGFSQRID